MRYWEKVLKRVVGHGTGSTGNGCGQEPDRAPGVFGQRLKAQGGIVGLPCAGPGVLEM